jgi:hypothetical protein
MYNINVGLKSDRFLYDVISVVLDLQLQHELLLKPYRLFRIQKCKAFIEQLTACQCSENDLGNYLLQDTKFLSNLCICNWKIRCNYTQY